jgi:hypothetical protein
MAWSYVEGISGDIKMTATRAQLVDWIKLLFAPARLLWQRDKTYVLIFLVGNILAGQVGILASLALSWQHGDAITTAWRQNLNSGAFYTFSISLVVSSLAIIGSEFIDAIRLQKPIPFREHKTIWSVVACAVLFIQAPLAGALLSTPSADFSRIQVSVTRAQSSARLAPSDASTSAVLSSDNTSENVGPRNEPRQSIQVLFWVASMFIALQLFCLYRIPQIPDSHAQQRNQEVADLTENAEQKHKTPFDEKI